MVLKELINQKGFPKIFFDSSNKKNQSFCIYELEEEIVLNSNGCFVNGYKIKEDPLISLQNKITKWKAETKNIACIGFCSYNLKDYLYPHINFKNRTDDTPLFWFAKPKTVYHLNDTNFNSKNVSLNELKNYENFSSYNNNIEKIKSKLKSGDVYQVNYTYQKKFTSNNKTQNLYYKIRNIAKPKYGWFIDLEDLQILSFSPERFFNVKNNTIYSNPIKGTMPRSNNIELDNKYKKQLQKSDKDRSENLMITDLIRNDLGKICEYGSIKVDNIFNIVSFETVHHMESKISGKLRANINEIEIFKALFPGGSITGAPKESAMKIIDDLENYSRELYTGSIGYIKSDGTMDFNIAIRTMIKNKKTLNYSVGGGIIWDSVSRDEWKETKTKAEILSDIIKSNE